MTHSELLEIVKWKAEPASTKLEEDERIVEEITRLAIKTDDAYYKIEVDLAGSRTLYRLARAKSILSGL
jgi:hypothetical protein